MSVFDTFLPINGLNDVVKGAGDVVRGLFGIGPTQSNAPEKSHFTIDQFRTEVMTAGLAEENRFEVFIGIPSCLTGTNSWGQYMQNSLLRVESVQFPAFSIYTKQRRIYGAAQPMPVAVDYGGDQGVTVTFLMDRDMRTKNMFDAWMDAIIPFETQLVAYPDTYTAPLFISQLDRSDGSVYMCVIDEAYPKHISVMNASAMGNGFQRVSVTFAYRKWSARDVQTLKSSLNGQNLQAINFGGDPIKSVASQIGSKVSSIEDSVVNSLSNLMPGTKFAYNPFA